MALTHDSDSTPGSTGASPSASNSSLPAEVPPLPPDATPEQKDEHWFKHVYQGDRMPQLTVRAVIMGGFLGMLMSASNLYTTLSIGWAFGVAITSCVLSFVIWNAFRTLTGGKLSQMSILENACMASTASAAGYSTGSTIATMFGSMVLLKVIPEGTPLSAVKTWDVSPVWVVVMFTFCTGLMGVFLAIPMKRQMINQEQLAFPTGTAAAETLRALYSASKEAMRKAYVLVAGLAAGLLIGFLRAPQDVLDSVPWLKKLFTKLGSFRIPAEFEIPVLNSLYTGRFHPAGMAFEPSALLIAAGMIVGMRISLSLVLSSLLLYAVVAPAMTKLDENALGPGSLTVMRAYERATENVTDPALIAERAVAEIRAEVDKLDLPDDGGGDARVIALAEGGAAAGLQAIQDQLAAKRTEKLIEEAAKAGIPTESLKLAERRAVRDAAAGTDMARAGAALGEAMRQADAKKLNRESLIDVAKAARADEEKKTDLEAGQAMKTAVFAAAEAAGADMSRVRAAAEKAAEDARANPGRESAKAALDEAVKIVYDEMENDPTAIEAVYNQTAQSTSVIANKQVADRTIDAILAEASRMGLETSAIVLSAERAAASAASEGTARFEAVREALEFQARLASKDAAPMIAAAMAVQLTDQEKQTQPAAMRSAILGGAAGTAGTLHANREAYVEQQKARAAAEALPGATYKRIKEAGDQAFQEYKYKNNVIIGWGDHFVQPLRWALWGGTAVMVFASLTSVALQWRTFARAFKGGGGSSVHAASMAAIEVPGRWMVYGMLPIAIAMVWLQIQAFHVAWWAGIIAVAMSFVLSMVASRATGETDTTPIGAMGKVMQLLFAVLAPGNQNANLASAGIAANSASSSADLLTDLKTGYLLGANPRKQFLAQFTGVFFGTLAIVPIWYLMVPTREKLESFALPATRSWEVVARLLTEGIGNLPQSAAWAILIGAAVGIILPIIERLLPAKLRKFMPSATGIGLAWVMPFTNAFSFFVGACIIMLWARLHKRSADNYNVPVASGLIAGESLMLAGLAISATVVGLFIQAATP